MMTAAAASATTASTAATTTSGLGKKLMKGLECQKNSPNELKTALGSHKTAQHGSKWLKVSLNGSMWVKTAQCGSKRLNVGQNGSKLEKAPVIWLTDQAS